MCSNVKIKTLEPAIVNRRRSIVLLLTLNIFRTSKLGLSILTLGRYLASKITFQPAFTCSKSTIETEQYVTIVDF